MKFQQHSDVMWSVYDSFIHYAFRRSLPSLVLSSMYFFRNSSCVHSNCRSSARGPGHWNEMRERRRRIGTKAPSKVKVKFFSSLSVDVFGALRFSARFNGSCNVCTFWAHIPSFNWSRCVRAETFLPEKKYKSGAEKFKFNFLTADFYLFSYSRFCYLFSR